MDPRRKVLPPALPAVGDDPTLSVCAAGWNPGGPKPGGGAFTTGWYAAGGGGSAAEMLLPLPKPLPLHREVRGAIPGRPDHIE